MACPPHFTVSNMAKAKPGLGFKQGVELEFRVAELAENLGQIVIKGPNDLDKNEHGFDVVAYDTKTDTLHIYEAKSGANVGLSDLGTFFRAWADDEVKKEKLFSGRLPQGILAQIPSESPSRKRIEDCISQGRLEYHLVGDRDTHFSNSVIALAR